MSQDMRFVSYQGSLGNDNAVSICHAAILNFSANDLEIVEFDTEAGAEAELLKAVNDGWEPRGQHSREVLASHRAS